MPAGVSVGQTPEVQLAGAVEASCTEWQEVRRLGWTELLDQDSRPSIILDLHLVDIRKGALGKAYANEAYHALPRDAWIRFDDNEGKFDFTGSSHLAKWAFDSALPHLDPAHTIIEHGWAVTRLTVRERWRLLQGVRQTPSGDLPAQSHAASNSVPIPSMLSPLSSSKPTVPFTSASTMLGPEMSRSVSGTRSPRLCLDEGIHLHPLLRAADWSNSTLGGPENWPPWMQQITATMLADPDPHIIIWKDRSVVYNDAVIPLITSKHPSSLGMDAAVAFEELWVYIEPFVTSVMATQKCRSVESMSLPMDRRGYLEETHFTFTLLPLFNGEGECVGVMDRFSEVTSNVLAARRLERLNLIAEKTGEASSLEDLWRKIPEALGGQPEETPYALFYSIKDNRSRIPTLPTSTSSWPRMTCTLESTVGIQAAEHPELQSFDPTDPEHFLSEPFMSVLQDGKLSVLKTADGTLPVQLQLVVPGRGFGDVTNTVLLSPIKVGGGRAVAVLLKALNPRRAVDGDYLGFARLVSRRLHESFDKQLMPVEERQFRAEVEQAAMVQSSETQELILRTRQAEDDAAAFTKMAENAPIGMYMYTRDGFPLFLNDYYFEMTGLERKTFTKFTWLQSIHPDDREMSMEWYRRLYEDKLAITFEFRMNKKYVTTGHDGTEVATEAWALASAFPQLDENGEVINVIGWQIDISSQKWAEQLQRARLKDALESRAQAHRFIDMVSHECRNPLSAILQCADGILTSLSSLDLPESQQEALRDAIETVQDSAQTIVLCAQHQKRIVDDILTVSKLDGNHLIITPDKADPLALVDHVLKMYEAELGADEIKTTVNVLPGYKDLGIDYVLLDPSRTLQVLINLVTNAIKFTARSKRRMITVSVDASRKRPATGAEEIEFVPQRTARLSPSSTHPDWASGRDLYVQFAVRDTGRGMSAEEIKKLFERFAQASPRTHIKYGGSGLGLFISRQLTELQGGQIGVSSKLGSGSTFAFYITARTSSDPNKMSITPVYTPGPASSNSDGNAAFPFPQVPGQNTTNTATQGPPDQGTFTTAPAMLEMNTLEHQNLHVLVVEDNLINQRVMAKQLRRLGCTVHVANHGLEALDFLKRSVFAVFPPSVCCDSDHELDVILMDIEMPIMNGMTCVREIRGMERRGELNGHVPVIAVTANARDAQQANAVKEGMDQVVTKPFRIPELVPKMQNLVKEAKRARPT